MVALSNTDALLVAVPMIGTLVVGYFRLDELLGKPRKTPVRGHSLSGMNASGQLTCLDPDGTAVEAGRSMGARRAVAAVRRPRPEAERV